MRLFLLILAVISLPFMGAKAQTNCATEMPEHMTNWLREYKQNNPGGAAFKSQVVDSVLYLPIKIHIVGTSQGGSYYKLGTLFEAFCTLNSQYAPYNWQFYIYEDINYINNDDLNDHDGNYRSTIRNQCIANVVNMFFVDDPSGACGYYSGYDGYGFPGNAQGYIAIQDGACASPDNSTIAHELGHFFSLPHTFYGWEGRSSSASATFNDERVDGSNCGFAGDYFCDTPADFLSDRWQCPYNQNKTDYNGDPYQVDGTLYMSYSNDACTGRFSDEQIDAMNAYLSGQRNYMLNIQYPGYTKITDTTEIIYPPLNANNVPANYATLSWTPIANATHYFVELKYNTPSPSILFDTIITGTSLIMTNLDTYRSYAFRVRAFNPYSTCSPTTNFTLFSTGDDLTFVPELNVTPISCNNAYDGIISLNVNGGQSPFSYNWSNGAQSASLINVTEGNYFVTVTDASNDSVVIGVSMEQPDSLNVDVNVLPGNVLSATASGGTPPYIYSWSNGSQASGITLGSEPSYTVTIIDANGCSVEKTYNNPAGINSVVQDASFNLYPNPAGQNTGINLSLNATEAFNADVQVYDNTGRLVIVQNHNFNTGKQVVTIQNNNLEAGIYFVKLSGTELNITRKLVIFQ